MRCDRAECLTEASRASIADGGEQTKSTDYADYTEGKKQNQPKKAQKAQMNSKTLCASCAFLWPVLSSL